jgi:hypothetical protein
MNCVWLSLAWSLLGILYILLLCGTTEAFPTDQEEGSQNEKNSHGESYWQPPSFQAQIDK